MVESGAKRWAHVLPTLNERKFYMLQHPKLKSVAAHSHLFFELTYVLSGTVEHTIDGRHSVLQAGDYFLVDYGSIHAYRTPDHTSFSNIDCLFLPELLDPSLKGKESLRDVFEHYLVNFNLQVMEQNPSQMVFHDHDGRILKLLKRIERESVDRLPGYAEMVRCYLVEILLLTMRLTKDAFSAFDSRKLSAYLIGYVSKHYSERISLAELSLQMNYSLPYVSKRFKEEIGMSFVEYLQSFRIKQACRLLLSTDKNMPEISEQIGYRDVKYFSQVFKSIIGVPPASFRRLHKE
ncbi:MAG: helix-turn-helix domain-containing protein [Clostridia bacterium]|nr:helix-turn-helix domain-containing protein [Clostridia bacterium]